MGTRMLVHNNYERFLSFAWGNIMILRKQLELGIVDDMICPGGPVKFWNHLSGE